MFCVYDFIKKMSRFSEKGSGVTRLPFSAESADAFKYLVNTMHDMGLCVKTDPYGTVHGHMDGSSDESIVIASHYDSVIHGGAYDGIVGIAVGLATTDYFLSSDIQPKYGIDVLALNDEEGIMFNQGFLSSKAITGTLTENEVYERRTGVPLSEFLTHSPYGRDCITLPNSLKCAKNYIEIHIEQGGMLESENCDIGIVDSITGIRRYSVTVIGDSGHAGTVSMQHRSDALVAASTIISNLQNIPLEFPGAVLTVGCLNVYPNAVNVIPDKVVFSIDMRSSSETDLTMMDEHLRKLICSANVLSAPKIVVHLEELLNEKPVYLKQLPETLFDKIALSGIRSMHINSGAGHDAQIFAPYLDTYMLFVPSQGGYSHRPEEFTKISHIEKAVQCCIQLLT